MDDVIDLDQLVDDEHTIAGLPVSDETRAAVLAVSARRSTRSAAAAWANGRTVTVVR